MSVHDLESESAGSIGWRRSPKIGPHSLPAVVCRDDRRRKTSAALARGENQSLSFSLVGIMGEEPNRDLVTVEDAGGRDAHPVNDGRMIGEIRAGRVFL